MSFDVEIFAEKIFVFKNIFNDTEHAIRMMDTMDDILTENDVFKKSEPWLASFNPNSHRYGIKRMSDKTKVDTTSPEIKEFYLNIYNAFKKAAEYYFDKLGIEYKEKYHTNIAMFKYETNKDMGPHVDDDEDGVIIPVCTGLIYLNSDKIGGDLYFKEQDVLVKSEAGTMVLFPCTKPFYHQSTMIESGIKYSIGTGWKYAIDDK
jgi:hypothetical protein